MNQTEGRRIFAGQHLGVKLTHLRGMATAKKRAQHIITLLIDSSNLTDGTLTLDRYKTLGAAKYNPVEIAQRALSGHTSALAVALATALPAAKNQHEPITKIANRVVGTVWHDGESYSSYWVGKPTSIMHYADLTENERESFLMTCRKLANHGATVYAVAYGHHHVVPQTYKAAHPDVVGLLVLHSHLYPGVEKTVADIRLAGINIVYASQDHEHTVRTLAQASCIATGRVSPYVWRPGRELPLNQSLYAALDDSSLRKVRGAYPATNSLVVDRPLPEFWRALASFLH